MITIRVYGKPAPGGSKRAFVIRGKGGDVRGARVTDDSKRSKPWKAAVSSEAADVMQGQPLVDGPVGVHMIFYVARPKGHFGTGRNAGIVKASAPDYPAVKPDVLKLARSTEDALTGIVWRDDAQIVSEQLEKHYGEPEGVAIRVWSMRGGLDCRREFDGPRRDR